MQKKHGLFFTLFFILTLCAIAVIAGCDQQRQQPTLPTLYVFGAEWCNECHAQQPYVAAIKATGRLYVVELDYDRDRKMAQELQVTDLPCYIVYNANREIYRGNSAADIYNYLHQ